MAQEDVLVAAGAGSAYAGLESTTVTAPIAFTAGSVADRHAWFPWMMALALAESRQET